MPSTVVELFAARRPRPAPAVRWGTPVPESGPSDASWPSPTTAKHAALAARAPTSPVAVRRFGSTGDPDSERASDRLENPELVGVELLDRDDSRVAQLRELLEALDRPTLVGRGLDLIARRGRGVLGGSDCGG